MTRALVAGGAGFLGSHVCERLLASGRTVLCVDNFSTGSRRNVSQLEPSPKFQLIVHDINDPFFERVDEIYNFASPAAPSYYQRYAINTLKTNVLGTLNLLDLARRTGARILQASTSEIYGDPLIHPQSEEYLGNVNPIGPRACYDEGKRCAETLFFDFHRTHGVDIRVARIFNTYGPRMSSDDGRVVTTFLKQALSGHPITVYGDGSQTRSFCFVSDTVEALCRFMEQSQTQGPMNIGNPEEVSVLELAHLIRHVTSSKSIIVNRPLPTDDPRRRCPDISLAMQALNWQPCTALERGIARTAAYLLRGELV